MPLWTSYFLFDIWFVIVICIAYTATVSAQLRYWWEPAYMFPVCLFYGINAILISYIISTWANSQLSSFLWTLSFSVISFFVLALSYVVSLAVL